MFGHQASLMFLYPSDTGERRPQIFLPPVSLGKIASESFIQPLNKYSLNTNSVPSSFLINVYAINNKNTVPGLRWFKLLLDKEDIQIIQYRIIADETDLKEWLEREWLILFIRGATGSMGLCPVKEIGQIP